MNPPERLALRLRSWLVYSQEALAPWQPRVPLVPLVLGTAQELTWSSKVVRCSPVQCRFDSPLRKLTIGWLGKNGLGSPRDTGPSSPT